MLKKRYTYKLLPLLLAFLMFFTSTGYSIDLHYCQGQLKNFSLFGKAKSCHQLTESKSVCKHKVNKSCHLNLTKSESKDCCTNKSFDVELDTDFTTNSLDLDLVKSSLVFELPLSFKIHSNFLLKKINKKRLKFYYKPPLPERNYQVLFQSFLI